MAPLVPPWASGHGEAENYLFPGEQVALIVRPHPVVLARHVVAPLITIAVFAAFPNSLTLTILVVFLARFSWDFGLWWVDRYILTTERILSLSGIITKSVISMPLGKITDLAYSRTLAGRLLGYGSINLESAGQRGLEKIEFLPDPDHFYRGILSLALTPRTRRRFPTQDIGKSIEDDDGSPDLRDTPESHVVVETGLGPRTEEVPAVRKSDD